MCTDDRSHRRQPTLLVAAFFIFISGFILPFVSGNALLQDASLGREQTTFMAEESFQHPVALPAGALGALLKTDEVRENLARAEDREQRNPALLFQAAEVHLHGRDDADLVVLGKFPLAGADNYWFWVVRPPNKNPRVILFAGAHSLEVMADGAKGYRDIRTVWSSASQTVITTYRFDGRRYKRIKEKRQWEH